MVFNRKTLVAILATTLSAGSAYAIGTGDPFTVNENVVTGVGPGASLVNANVFDFSYNAIINQTILGAFDGIGDTFTETGNISVSSYKMGILTQPAFLNAPALVGGYGIVGTFNASGVAKMNASLTGIDASFNTFGLNLQLDANQDGIGDGAAFSLGTAVLNGIGQAHIFGGLANGDFDVQLQFTPTAFGNTFFVNPSPFLVDMEVTGVTTTLTGASLTQSFVATMDGSGNATVTSQQVPEPASLALIGLGLLSVGMVRRRQKNRTQKIES